MSVLLYILVALLMIVCAFMVLLILIQKGRGGGLASAFGGAGGNTAFGSKTGDVLTWATSVVFLIFLILAIAADKTATAVNKVYSTTQPAAIPAPSDSENPLNTATPAFPPAAAPGSAAPAAPSTPAPAAPTSAAPITAPAATPAPAPAMTTPPPTSQPAH